MTLLTVFDCISYKWERVDCWPYAAFFWGNSKLKQKDKKNKCYISFLLFWAGTVVIGYMSDKRMNEQEKVWAGGRGRVVGWGRKGKYLNWHEDQIFKNIYDKKKIRVKTVIN